MANAGQATSEALKLQGGEEVVNSRAPDVMVYEYKSGDTVLFLRPDPNKRTGKLVFQRYDEQGRVSLCEVDCAILQGANMVDSEVHFLRAADEPDPDASCVSWKQALERALNKQVGFEDDYKGPTSCLKYLAKEIIPFPANAIVEMPSLYNQAKSVYKVLRKGRQAIKEAAKTEGPLILSWMGTCAASSLVSESTWPSFAKVLETMWEESYLKRAEESLKDEKGETLKISVLLKRGEETYKGQPVAMLTLKFKPCEELDQNIRAIFAEYLAGYWKKEEEEEYWAMRSRSYDEDDVESGGMMLSQRRTRRSS